MPRRGQRREAPAHVMREVLAENVRAAMARAGIGAIELATAAKIGRRTVNRLLAKENSTLDTVGAIADALGLEPFELLVRKRRPLLRGSERRISEERAGFVTNVTSKAARIKNS